MDGYHVHNITRTASTTRLVAPAPCRSYPNVQLVRIRYRSGTEVKGDHVETMAGIGCGAVESVGVSWSQLESVGPGPNFYLFQILLISIYNYMYNPMYKYMYNSAISTCQIFFLVKFWRATKEKTRDFSLVLLSLLRWQCKPSEYPSWGS